MATQPIVPSIVSFPLPPRPWRRVRGYRITPAGEVPARLVVVPRMTAVQVRATVAEYVADHPELTYSAVAEKLRCHPSTVSAICRAFGIVRSRRLRAKDLERLLDYAS
jgi:hypothetical protein